MLTVLLPPTFVAERRYCAQVLLKEFLGIDFEVRVAEMQPPAVRIQGANNRCLSIEDHFFRHFAEGTQYLDCRHVPEALATARDPLVAGASLSFPFGRDHFEITPETIVCGVDLIASAFFFLSRWEEAVVPARDAHGRFPAHASLSGRAGTLHRPLVNEYLALLEAMLRRLFGDMPFRKQGFRPVLTHDVDTLYKWRNRWQWGRSIAGDLLRRRDWHQAKSHGAEGGRILGDLRNALRTYSWLMDAAESCGQRARFYFAAGNGAPPDPFYAVSSRQARAVVKAVRQRGHVIGFHPGYRSAEDPAAWRAEKRKLERRLRCGLEEGRQHYLRFSVPGTWSLWADNGMKVDSTCGFADHEGFRCGTGLEFTAFDVRRRVPLPLKERPLIVMDATLLSYRNLGVAESVATIGRYLQTARRFAMPLTLLLHPSAFYLDPLAAEWTAAVGRLFSEWAGTPG